MGRLVASLVLGVCLCARAAFAQPCGDSYQVSRGDSLSLIALRTYKDAGKWTSIHETNRTIIGEDPDTILVGTQLTLRCINGRPRKVESSEISPPAKPFQEPLVEKNSLIETAPAEGERELIVPPEPPQPLKIVTGDGQAPFSDQRLPGGGMLAEVMAAALKTVAKDGVETFRINDWGSHFDPLLTDALMDISFPWPRPDCSDTSGHALCEGFLFSDPMFEMLMLMFVNVADPVPLSNVADVTGRRLCRPTGRMVFMLDQGGRGWLRDGKVTLIRAPTVQNCFDLLVKGDVDAVVVNEFTGRLVVDQMGLADQVEGLSSVPLGIVSLHAVASHQNPKARTIIEAVDDGLGRIRRSGAYQQIIDRHLKNHWAGL